MQKNDYKIKNKSEDTAELMLYGIVGDYWDDMDAKDIVRDIKKITAKNINVSIYSSGGSVFAGLAIYNALKDHPANVTVKIDSLAASIASVIAMAGTVVMPENAFMMIHNPWSMAYGEESDMLKMAEVLGKIKTSLISVYRNKTDHAEDYISDLMDAETWFTAKEAVENGFADSVINAVSPKNFKAPAIFNHCRNIPDKIKEALNKRQAPTGAQHKTKKEGMNMEITMELLAKDAPDLLAKIQTDAKTSGYEAGIEAGVKQERERVSALLSIEDADAETKATAIKDGVSVEASYKLFYEAEKGKKAAELAALNETTPGSVGQQGKQAGEDGDKKTFMAAVDEYQKTHGCTRTDALKAVAKANPELHAAFLTGGK